MESWVFDHELIASPVGAADPRRELGRQMIESEIQILKDNIDKTVDIETIDGELLIAEVISVFDDQAYDEHELFYKMISSNKLDAYRHLGDAAGYALDFDRIQSVKPHSDLGSQKP